MADLKLSLLKILQQAEDPIPTLELAKRVGKSTTKEINPSLYSLLSSKQVEKIAEENGSNPRWRLSPQARAREAVLALLNSKEAIPVKRIQEQLRTKLEKTQLNSLLYSLQKEGLVTKEANPDGTNPRWLLTPN